jgi:hypothetical protein
MGNQAKKKQPRSARLRPSEALYGFVGWLTTRKNKITLSSAHTATPVAELLKAYCEKNGLAPCRETYHKLLRTPEHMEGVTDELPQAASNMRPLEPQEVYEKVRGLIGSLTYEKQNVVVAELINQLRLERQLAHDDVQSHRMNLEREERRAYSNLTDFEAAARGDFAVFTKVITQQAAT